MARSNAQRKSTALEQPKPVCLACLEVVAKYYDEYFQAVKAQMISNWRFDGLHWEVEKAKNLVSGVRLSLFNERINFAETSADFLALNCHSVVISAALRTSNFPNQAEPIKTECLKQVRAVIESSLTGVSAEDVFVDRFSTIFQKLFNSLKAGTKRTA